MAGDATLLETDPITEPKIEEDVDETSKLLDAINVSNYFSQFSCIKVLVTFKAVFEFISKILKSNQEKI